MVEELFEPPVISKQIKDMNGILICKGEAKRKNIGDYVQSVAQEQFFQKVDTYVEREHLDSFESKEKVKLIMSAWFMRHTENFPPSPCIDPLFISFHIVPRIEKKFFTEKCINYLKRYEPIGARDTGTKELLEKYGIKSYFSGCLTLTLGLKYKTQEKNGKVYFVDPFYEIGGGGTGVKKYIIAILMFLKHPIKILKLNKSFVAENRSSIQKISPKFDHLLMCATFYDTYSTVFEDDVLLNASYVTHDLQQSSFSSEEEKMSYARNLISNYAKAKLVVTSRIHCGLPCLGVETPVIFVNSDSLAAGVKRSGGRFGGLINLFHTMYWTKKGVRSDFNVDGKISNQTRITNKDDYKILRDNLIDAVQQFVSNNE